MLREGFHLEGRQKLGKGRAKDCEGPGRCEAARV